MSAGSTSFIRHNWAVLPNVIAKHSIAQQVENNVTCQENQEFEAIAQANKVQLNHPIGEM
jgi:hypothetical protein